MEMDCSLIMFAGSNEKPRSLFGGYEPTYLTWFSHLFMNVVYRVYRGSALRWWNCCLCGLENMRFSLFVLAYNRKTEKWCLMDCFFTRSILFRHDSNATVQAASELSGLLLVAYREVVENDQKLSELFK